MVNIIGLLSFVSSKQKITIKLKGVNSVSINFGTETKNYSLNKKQENIVEHDFGNTESHYITVNNAQNITEIDISNNEINNISLCLCTLLKKFLAYNNNIYSLNFTNSNALQYVHIQNNPMCNNESAMTNMINSLPDRNGKAYGSIIMYDFVPPREMNNMTEAQQSIRELRRKLENISIPKDWYFGSGIIYNEVEYAKCMNIKDSHVIDVWESAEYGEGLIVSSKENGYALNHPEIESSRIIEHLIINNNNLEKKTSTSISEDDYQSHGTKTLSIIGSSNKVYGVLPRCNFKLLDSSYNQNTAANVFYNLFRNFYADDKIDIVYLSQASTNLEQATDYINFLSNNNRRLVFIASSNGGDNILQTDDHEISQTPGYHLSDGESKIFVSGLDNNNVPAALSMWCQDINISENVAAYVPNFLNSTKDFTYRYYQGTSYSAPLVAGYAGIIQILFAKKHNRKPTKDELANEMFRRCKTLKEYHRYKVGNGRIDFSTYNTVENIDALTESIETEDSITMDLYSKYKLEYKILPDSIYNSNITIESTDNNVIQVSKDNTLFALNVGSCEVVVFSNDGSIKKNISVAVNSITAAKIEEENTSMVGKFERENFVPNAEWSNSINNTDIKLNTVDVDNNLNITSVNGYLEIPHIKNNFTVSFNMKNIDAVYNGRILSLNSASDNVHFALNHMLTIKDGLISIGYMENNTSGKTDYNNIYYSPIQNIKNIYIGQENIITCVFNRDTQRILTYINGCKVYENILVDRAPDDLKLCFGNSFLHKHGVVGTNFSNILVFNKALSNDEVLDNIARQLKINNNITEIEGDDDKVDYKGGVPLISGLIPANGGKFPLVHASMVHYGNEENDDGSFKSIGQKIEEISKMENNINYATSEDIDDIITDLFG